MPWPADIGGALLAPERPVPSGITQPERFAVYRNNVVVGLIEALAAVGVRGVSDTSDADEPSPETSPAPEHSKRPAVDADVWNRDAALGSVANNVQSLQRLVEAFVASWPESRDALRRAKAEGDVETIARLAHKLKGSLRLLAAPAASRAAEALERAARDAQAECTGDLVDELITAVDRFGTVAAEDCERQAHACSDR
jgi:HPt (histidine-containing phosphotransfer) domain-containing protein